MLVLWIAVLLLSAYLARSEIASAGAPDEDTLPISSAHEFAAARQRVRGLLVVPGVGRGDRLETLVQSLRLLYSNLKGENAQWDCVVYVYAPRSDEAFWGDENVKNSLKYVRTICDVVEHPNKRVTENLRAVQPALIRRTFTHVFILFDDCKLVPSSKDALTWDLDGLLDVMVYNRMNLVSPRVENANKGGGQAWRKIMYTKPVEGIEGYESSFVEMFAWVMTIESYGWLWELLIPSVNPYGWGYDLWYNNYAKHRAVNSRHKQGIATSFTTVHDQSLESRDDGKSGATTGRSENATVGEKWKAKNDQEKYFHVFHGYNLNKASLEIKNHEWNGAVLGYLHPVPLDFREASFASREVVEKPGRGGRPKNGFGRKPKGKRGPGQRKRAGAGDSVDG